jgi:hypothetical protein
MGGGRGGSEGGICALSHVAFVRIGANSFRIFDAEFGDEKDFEGKFVSLAQKKNRSCSRTSCDHRWSPKQLGLKEPDGHHDARRLGRLTPVKLLLSKSLVHGHHIFGIEKYLKPVQGQRGASSTGFKCLL